MPTRLTLFRLAAAAVIGLSSAIWPPEAAYAVGLFLFMLAAGAGYVEDLTARRDPVEERPFHQAAHRTLIVAALLALLMGDPYSAPVLAPPLLAILGREILSGHLRDALARRGARAAAPRSARWRALAEFLAVAAIFADPTIETPGPRLLAPIGLGLLWLAAALTLWEGWREAAAARRRLSAPRRAADPAMAPVAPENAPAIGEE